MVVPHIGKITTHQTIMKQELTETSKVRSIQYNRYAYIIFIMLVIYMLIKGDIESATINLGVALIFDPFDSEVKWQDRPLYQRAWLTAHVCLTFAGFIYLVIS